MRDRRGGGGSWENGESRKTINGRRRRRRRRGKEEERRGAGGTDQLHARHRTLREHINNTAVLNITLVIPVLLLHCA